MDAVHKDHNYCGDDKTAENEPKNKEEEGTATRPTHPTTTTTTKRTGIA